MALGEHPEKLDIEGALTAARRGQFLARFAHAGSQAATMNRSGRITGSPALDHFRGDFMHRRKTPVLTRYFKPRSQRNLNERLITILEISAKRPKSSACSGALHIDGDLSRQPPIVGETSGASALAGAIRGCQLCHPALGASKLPHAPNPILRLSGKARLAVASQAPGIRAHISGVPFDDPSGHRLREWMGIGPDLFYDADKVAIVPMGFCFPGHDAAKGDLPPRRECRPAWHDLVFAAMPQLETILAVGLHAIDYHRTRLHPHARRLGLTEHVRDWRDLYERAVTPRLIPLPHPSWRNSAWLKRHPWFEAEVLPVVRADVLRLVG